MARARSTIKTPETDSLLGAALLSALLHAAVLFGAFVVWPFIAPPAELPSDVVPVDLLTVADMTNVMAQQKVEDEKPVEQPPPPEPTPPPEPVQEQQQATTETPPPPPEPEEPADDAQAEKVEPPKPEPPKPPEPPAQRYAMSEPRVKPKPEKKKDDFEGVLRDLDNLTKEPKAPPAATKSADRSLKGAGAQTALTASEIDALKAKLAKCWNVPVGAPDLSALVFRVHFSLNQDGTVSGAPQLLDKGGLGDPYFRAAADSAIRAIHMCGPYELPPQKYASWQDITITFDPTNMGY